MSNMGGDGGDHPAEQEIRITAQLAAPSCSLVLLWWWACGAHKTALICRWLRSGIPFFENVKYLIF